MIAVQQRPGPCSNFYSIAFVNSIWCQKDDSYPIIEGGWSVFGVGFFLFLLELVSVSGMYPYLLVADTRDSLSWHVSWCDT